MLEWCNRIEISWMQRVVGTKWLQYSGYILKVVAGQRGLLFSQHWVYSSAFVPGEGFGAFWHGAEVRQREGRASAALY